MGITGTWEGYVPVATDLYLRGNNIAGFKPSNSYTTLESGGIMVNRGTLWVTTSRSYNLTPYTRINIEMYITFWATTAVSQYLYLEIYKSTSTSSGNIIGSVDLSGLSTDINRSYIMSLNIASVSYVANGLSIKVNGGYTTAGSHTSTSISGYCYRIWLS